MAHEFSPTRTVTRPADGTAGRSTALLVSCAAVVTLFAWWTVRDNVIALTGGSLATLINLGWIAPRAALATPEFRAGLTYREVRRFPGRYRLLFGAIVCVMVAVTLLSR